MTFILATTLTKTGEIISLCCDETMYGDVYSLQINGNLITYLNNSAPGALIDNLSKSLVSKDHIVIAGSNWLWVISLKEPYPSVPLHFINGIENASFDGKILRVKTGSEIESFTIDLAKSIWERAWIINSDCQQINYFHHTQPKTQEQKEDKQKIQNQILFANTNPVVSIQSPPSYTESANKWEATEEPPQYSDISQVESTQETSAKENARNTPLINFSQFRNVTNHNDFHPITAITNELKMEKTLILESSTSMIKLN